MGGVNPDEAGDVGMDMVNAQVGGTPHEGAGAGAMGVFGLGVSVWVDGGGSGDRGQGGG